MTSSGLPALPPALQANRVEGVARAVEVDPAALLGARSRLARHGRDKVDGIGARRRQPLGANGRPHRLAVDHAGGAGDRVRIRYLPKAATVWVCWPKPAMPRRIRSPTAR